MDFNNIGRTNIPDMLPKALGCFNEAALLSLCLRWDADHGHKAPGGPGWFYLTHAQIEEKWSWGRKKAGAVFARLVAKGLLTTKLEGIPVVKYYKVQEAAVVDLLGLGVRHGE